MPRTTAAHVAAIRQTATRAGIAWPDGLDAALDAATVTLDPPDQHKVAALTYEALKAGRDPADDVDVAAALTAFQLATAVPDGMLEDIAALARADALNGHADVLMERLQAAVTTADQTIEAARRAVPNLDVDNHDQAGALRPEQAKRWAEARDAAAIVGAAIQCWKLVNSGTAGGRHGDVLIAADLTADQLDQLTGVKPTYKDVIAAGWPLNLATPTELRARTERIADQRDQQHVAAAAAQREAHRATHGIAVRIR